MRPLKDAIYESIKKSIPVELNIEYDYDTIELAVTSDPYEKGEDVSEWIDRISGSDSYIEGEFTFKYIVNSPLCKLDDTAVISFKILIPAAGPRRRSNVWVDFEYNSDRENMDKIFSIISAKEGVKNILTKDFWGEFDDRVREGMGNPPGNLDVSALRDGFQDDFESELESLFYSFES